MRSLSVAERELRAAARRSSTYFVRWLTGLAFFGLLLWLLWVMDGFSNRRLNAEIFHVFATFIFIYCLLLGTARTADCLSAERREGTLGLLFLTNLNGADIVLGKLASHALATVYGLLAIFPILGLPLLLGGITFTEFGRTLLALLGAIGCALTCGLLASAWFTRQFPAIAFATVLALVWGLGLLGGAEIVASAKGSHAVTLLLAWLCPLYPLVSADGSRWYGNNDFWLSLGINALLCVGGLGAVMLRLSRSWRDRPEVRTGVARWKFWARPSATNSLELRRRLMAVHPFYWLAGRQQVSAPIFMLLAIGLVILTVTVTAPTFTHLLRRESFAPLLGNLLAWLITGLGLHVLTLYYAAMIAAQRLAEDKHTGALEMVLCTPTTEAGIRRGLWLAFLRRMAFPAGAVILGHAIFVWHCLVMTSLSPPGDFAAGELGLGEILLALLGDGKVRGQRLEWELIFLMRCVLGFLPLMMLAWLALGAAGRWLGLSLKQPGFAPLIALAQVLVPPVLLFSLTCYAFDEAGVMNQPNRQVFSLLFWTALLIGSSHCLLVMRWASHRLRHNFRTLVTDRFQPGLPRRWWRPTWRGVGKFCWRAGGTALGLTLLVAAWFGYENWRAQREWRQFQAERISSGAATSFALPAVASVAPGDNFAGHPIFSEVVFGPSPALRAVLDKIYGGDSFDRYANDSYLHWPHERQLPLVNYLGWFELSKPTGLQTNNQFVAPFLEEALAAHASTLRAWAEAATRPHLQLSTNLTPEEVIRSVRPEYTAYEKMHLLFIVRAVTALQRTNSAAAAADVVTSLKLARLAAQTADARAAMRQQLLLGRALQPLWEGLSTKQWTEPQLAAFQHELEQFNLVTDFTNSLQHLVTAYGQLWAEFPNRPRTEWRIPESAGGHRWQSEWGWQPRTWWWDHCRQLHAASEIALRKIDPVALTVRLEDTWDNLEGLPLDETAYTLLEPYSWAAAKSTLLAWILAAWQQARVAIALEQHRYHHNVYPARLEEVLPTPAARLGIDPITGRLIFYERLSDTSYALRSTGPDGFIQRNNQQNQDDWSWAYPTNAPAPNAPPAAKSK